MNDDFLRAIAVILVMIGVVSTISWFALLPLFGAFASHGTATPYQIGILVALCFPILLATFFLLALCLWRRD